MKQIHLNKLHTTKSPSHLASRVSRRRKTGAFPGLRLKANPKQGGDYEREARIECQSSLSGKLSLSASSLSQEAIPPLAGNCILKQIHLNKLHKTKSLSRHAFRVSRRSKTSGLLGLLLKANPKQGGDYKREARIECQSSLSGKLSLSASNLSQEAIPPLAGNCILKQICLNVHEPTKSLSRRA
ncbi:hypothetical protein R0K17_02540 [Planococcus sp. SIMBA_143]